MSTPDVRPGQIWADNDKRSSGRTIRVDEIIGSPQGDRVAVCTILTNRDAADPNDWGTDMRGRKVRIKVRRFRPTSTGYRLIENVPA